MEYIRKIPLLLGTGAGLLIGLIGFSSGVPNKENMLNMCVGMVIFYTVGILVRSTVKNIAEHTLIMMMKKKEEEKKRKKDRENQQKESEETLGVKLDLTTEDANEPTGDDFEGLPVAEFIKNELK